MKVVKGLGLLVIAVFLFATCSNITPAPNAEAELDPQVTFGSPDGNAGAKFTNSLGKGNGSGGTCFGDSGGPLFHGTSNVTGAVVSWGITPCIGVDYQFRLDTSIAQDFILPILGENQ